MMEKTKWQKGQTNRFAPTHRFAPTIRPIHLKYNEYGFIKITEQMTYDPIKHHRRSIRLKGYDYSQSGFYFITLCVQKRDYLFGEIVNHQMILNDAGKMVEKWFHELGNKYPDIECGEYVVMPNHFHCIIENNGNGNPNMKDKTGTTWKPNEYAVGADLRVCPDEMGDFEMGEHIGLPQQGLPQQGSPQQGSRQQGSRQPVGSPIRNIVQWFKSMSTNEYIRGVKTMGWQRFDGKLWQKNYWEHIIRSQVSFDSISSYIYENPKNWNTDKLK